MSLSGDPRGSSWRGWGDLLAAVVREDRVQPLPGERGHRRALFGGENFQLVPYAPWQVERDRHRPDAAGWAGGGCTLQLAHLSLQLLHALAGWAVTP